MRRLERLTKIFGPRTGGEMVDVDFVRCPKRLAYSALPFLDVFVDPAAGQMFCADLDIQGANSPLDVQPHWIVDAGPQRPAAYDPLADLRTHTTASQAAALTGLDDVQQRFGLTGGGQTVAVIDTGIAYDHIALGGGYGPGHRVVGGYDFAENDADPYDDAPGGFHGTGVAGVVGGRGPTHAGVATGVDFVALRVFDDMGQGTLTQVEAALRWVHEHRNAFENPISVVNLSLGAATNSTSPPSFATLEDELRQLYEDGILVVASAGNSFKQYNAPGLAYPASSPYVLPVASVDADGSMSDFSQRDPRVLAAPGRQITTSVPDHVYGADGRVDDYSALSGTSFSAPYVAGAAALLREAYNVAGVESVAAETLRQTLMQAAGSLYDAATSAAYATLDIYAAIEAVLPQDTAGDTWSDAASLNVEPSVAGGLSGFMNELGDRDVYRWTATSDGTLDLEFASRIGSNIAWSLLIDGASSPIGGEAATSLLVEAGRSYAISVGGGHQIGSFDLRWSFTADQPPDDPIASRPVVPLGEFTDRSWDVAVDSRYTVQAARDGIATFRVDGLDAGAHLQIYAAGQLLASAEASSGLARFDVEAVAGQTFDVAVIGSADAGSLRALTVVSIRGETVLLTGSEASEAWSVRTEDGLQIDIGGIEYRWAADANRVFELDLGGGADSLTLNGGASAEAVHLYSDRGALRQGDLELRWLAAESVEYRGNGGPDRVYAFDTDGDDELTARPNSFELRGAGYFFAGSAERIYVDASKGGNDYAYIFDSAGDDRLSIRPQFSSIAGDQFFNYVTGFERVYAYAAAGGVDTATLYDSAADDSFASNGDIASIVGPGYYSYTRYFEHVESVASAGGRDTAAIHCPGGSSSFVGADFLSFSFDRYLRTARGFDAMHSFATTPAVATNSVDVAGAEPLGHAAPPSDLDSLSVRGSLDGATPVDNTAQTFALEYAAIGYPELAVQWVIPEDVAEGVELLAAARPVAPATKQDWLVDAVNSVEPPVDQLTLLLLDEGQQQESLLAVFAEIGDGR